MIAGNWYNALSIDIFLWMFAGCVGVYFWAKEWFTPLTSALTASFYALIPFHLEKIYIYFFYAEYIAAAIAPFCFLFLTRICRRNKKTDYLLFQHFIRSFGLIAYSVNYIFLREFCDLSF